MGGGWLLRAVFFSSCLMLLKAQPGVSCLRSTLSSDGRTLVTFLRQDAAGARLLYLTKWAEGARLLACQISQVSPGVAEGYGASCGDDESRGQAPTRGFDISALLFRDAPCALAPTRAPELTERAEGRGRRKRSWMFPGTLWCGSGSKAVGYEQLGEGVGLCCREHDHCSRIIPAFTVNYGVFNPNFYTVSHCECDQRFRQCLLDMNDSISSMVGYSFFSILKVPCFELKQMKRCTQMYWWGIVRKSLTGLKQRSHNPQKGLTSSAPRTPTTTRSPVPPSTQRLKPQHKPTTEVKGVTKSTKSKNKLPKQSICCGSSPVFIFTPADNQLQCRSLKHLDECKFKIPPLEKKYNLRNTESKTAYHCDCTSRCFKLLIFFFIFFCFLSRCSQGFNKASDLHQALKKRKKNDTETGVFSDGKKRIPVRLYKHCLKLQMKADIMTQPT
uniref:Group 3 secretory phospholipase A2-like n=1 Tax=Kryptolebias marmoratus TaxID=37003 RepID=A0A3Q3A410_KRYMA